MEKVAANDMLYCWNASSFLETFPTFVILNKMTYDQIN